MTVSELAEYLTSCNPEAVVRVAARYGSIAVQDARETLTKRELILGFGDDDG